MRVFDEEEISLLLDDNVIEEAKSVIGTETALRNNNATVESYWDDIPKEEIEVEGQGETKYDLKGETIYEIQDKDLKASAEWVAEYYDGELLALAIHLDIEADDIQLIDKVKKSSNYYKNVSTHYRVLVEDDVYAKASDSLYESFMEDVPKKLVGYIDAKRLKDDLHSEADPSHLGDYQEVKTSSGTYFIYKN
jgi:hypothetical protein